MAWLLSCIGRCEARSKVRDRRAGPADAVGTRCPPAGATEKLRRVHPAITKSREKLAGRAGSRAARTIGRVCPTVFGVDVLGFAPIEESICAPARARPGPLSGGPGVPAAAGVALTMEGASNEPLVRSAPGWGGPARWARERRKRASGAGPRTDFPLASGAAGGRRVPDGPRG